MAELSIFHYHSQQTYLHQLDSRIKLVCMLLFTMATGFADSISALIFMTLIITTLLFLARLPVLKLFRELRYFLFLLLITMLVHAWKIPGTPLLFLPGGFLTQEGLTSGVFYGWRIILLLFLSTILTGTTTLSSLREGIKSLLQSVPFLPAEKLATMFSLVFVFIPLLLDKAVEMEEAQKARCVENRKNPIKRLLFLVCPYLYHTFLYAEEVITAMEARCYTGKRTDSVFHITVRDWLCLVFTIIICLSFVLYL